MQADSSGYADGAYRFEITGLEPDTKYYYRVYVEGDDGKCGDFQTRTFTTKWMATARGSSNGLPIRVSLAIGRGC